jgi:aminoglycoside phosphotransferase (APT) family kinase protein
VTDEELAKAIARDLGTALAAEVPARSVAGVELVSGGRSAVTAFADITGAGGTSERVAVRAVARGTADLAVGTLADQFALLEVLRSEPVPAPRPLLLADGVEGTSYDLLVTSYLQGRVPQPWRSSGREEIARLRSSRRFRDDFIATLATIHEVSARRLPDRLAHEGDDSAAMHSARAQQRCALAFTASEVFEDDPVLTYCLLWLQEQRPATTSASGLVHGDYRLGNLVVDEEDRLCGVLDWELAEAGETLADVAWLCGPQGDVDGFAAGLFRSEELISAYERASGRPVDLPLFEYLTVEGTMRTCAVWARLSAVELQRGNLAMSMRCQESVLQLVAMCAKAVGLDEPAHRGGPTTPLLAGAAILADRLREALVVDSHALRSSLPVRNATSFLGRLSGLLSTTEYELYAEACARVADAADVAAGSSAGAWLSSALRRRHAAGGRLDDPGSDVAELRRLVAWSASADISFANLISATGVEGTER